MHRTAGWGAIQRMPSSMPAPAHGEAEAASRRQNQSRAGAARPTSAAAQEPPRPTREHRPGHTHPSARSSLHPRSALPPRFAAALRGAKRHASCHRPCTMKLLAPHPALAPVAATQPAGRRAPSRSPVTTTTTALATGSLAGHPPHLREGRSSVRRTSSSRSSVTIPRLAIGCLGALALIAPGCGRAGERPLTATAEAKATARSGACAPQARLGGGAAGHVARLTRDHSAPDLARQRHLALAGTPRLARSDVARPPRPRRRSRRVSRARRRSAEPGRRRPCHAAEARDRPARVAPQHAARSAACGDRSSRSPRVRLPAIRAAWW